MNRRDHEDELEASHQREQSEEGSINALMGEIKEIAEGMDKHVKPVYTRKHNETD